MTEYQFYALTAVILFFKMFAISIVQGIGRVNAKQFVTAEDARFFAHAPPAPDEAPIVKRAAMAWRNDLENIPIFLIVAGIYVMAGLSAKAFTFYCVVYMIARMHFLYTLAPAAMELVATTATCYLHTRKWGVPRTPRRNSWSRCGKPRCCPRTKLGP